MNRINFSNLRLGPIGRRLALILFMLMMAMAPLIIWAETAAPSPNLKKAPPAWMGMAVMFILAALVIFVSLLPAKRGHQD